MQLNQSEESVDISDVLNKLITKKYHEYYKKSVKNDQIKIKIDSRSPANAIQNELEQKKSKIYHTIND